MIRPDTDSPKEGEGPLVFPLWSRSRNLDLAVTSPSNFMDNVLPMLAVIAIVAIGVLLMISIRGKIARRNANRPSPRELIDQFKEAARHRTDAQSASAELLDAARQMAAKLDNKSARLEVLIRQADQRIAQMSQLPPAVGNNQAASPLTSDVRPTLPPMQVAPREPAVSLDPLTQSVYELADSGYQSIQIAQELDEQVGKVELILSLRDR